MQRNLRSFGLGRIAAIAALVVAGCAGPPESRAPEGPALTAAQARALIAARLPAKLADREGWATDIHAAMASLELAPTPQNVCAIVAVTEQESGFKVDPPVANLPELARKEIDRQGEKMGLPSLAVDAALALPSSDGRSYGERLRRARTERELSDIYEDMIGRVPIARRFLEDHNPVRTAGPMQVAISFARGHAAARPYPYPVEGSLRHEVFTRRGGMYFGIAHLLDYAASYDEPLYRFADFNAGHYASRNAAFQKAVSELTGIPLALDGDLLRYRGGKPADEPGATESALRILARRLSLDEAQIRRGLERGKEADFEQQKVYRRVFELADRHGRRPAPRAVLPRIQLQGAKITRSFTTEGFARRVDQRYRACLGRVVAGFQSPATPTSWRPRPGRLAPPAFDPVGRGDEDPVLVQASDVDFPRGVVEQDSPGGVDRPARGRRPRPDEGAGEGVPDFVEVDGDGGHGAWAPAFAGVTRLRLGPAFAGVTRACNLGPRPSPG